MAFPTLATNFEHEVLGTEYCAGYTNVLNTWENGFYCPQSGSSLAVYCCGTQQFKYCCTHKPTQSPDAGQEEFGDTSIYASDTPVIIAIACGILAVVILIIVSACFFCSCCIVHKKRTHVPGMYCVAESSTSSFPNNQSTQLLRSTSAETPSGVSGSGENQNQMPSMNPARPIMSIQPQLQMTMAPNESRAFTKREINPPLVVRSNSLGHGHQTWSEDAVLQQQQPIFHINPDSRGSHPGISSISCPSFIPPNPPPRFASNQNLASYGGQMLMTDRSNPREVQKLYEYGTSSPYTVSLDEADYQYRHGQGGQQFRQYRPVSVYDNQGPVLQDYPAATTNHKLNNGGAGYCTSTLPPCFRRSGSGSGSIGTGSGRGQGQPLKSILRNPLNPQNSIGSGQYYYAPAVSSSTANTTPTRSYTPLMHQGSSNIPRYPVEDFEFTESLLTSTSGSDQDQDVLYNSYNFPDYGGPSSSDPNRSETRQTNFSPSPPSVIPRGRRYSNPVTEYQHDINKLGDLDAESLRRLIELDLDSKL